jgi:hypothetical protein
VDARGGFIQSYSDTDRGAGYLMSFDEQPLFFILSGEDIAISGEALS